MARIVDVVVNRQIAPTPSDLQKKGALVSQGGTTLATQSTRLLTQLADLTPILAGSIAIASASWAAGVLTLTTATPFNWATGVTVSANIAGCSPSAYNAIGVLATQTSPNTFIAPYPSDPGPLVTPGVVTLEDVSELVAMATTFFAQGNNVAVSVLELGAGDFNTGSVALSTWLTNNKKSFYQYLLPRQFCSTQGAATFLSLLSAYSGPTAKVYFHGTTTLAAYGQFATGLYKCLQLTIDSPNIGTTEFPAAAKFYNELAYDPSAVSLVAPTRFQFTYGVTPYTSGNYDSSNPSPATISALDAAFVDYITTGAEGGISNTLIANGTTMDGRDFSYWYSVDWMQINLDLAAANEIINGSNNPQAPLYYDQNGINRLEGVLEQVANNGISFGLINTSIPPVIRATPFADYVRQHPGDYKTGVYNGFSVTYVPARGFTKITINVTVTDFLTS